MVINMFFLVYNRLVFLALSNNKIFLCACRAFTTVNEGVPYFKSCFIKSSKNYVKQIEYEYNILCTNIQTFIDRRIN